MRRTLEWIPLTEKENEEFCENESCDVIGRLTVSPGLNDVLVNDIKKIEGAGWVDEGVDCAAIYTVSSTEILVWTGCCDWCEHTRCLVSQILSKIKDVEYIGPSLD